MGFRVTIPSNTFAGGGRSWKDLSSNKQDVIERTIAHINNWNDNVNITELPEGVTIIEF